MLAKEVIQRVREIQVRTGRQVADVLAGQYVSVFKGRGIEFDEVRPYVPGDEIRTIDWKVTARLGKPYVKRFVEERQLTLMLMADISASQDFGSQTRSKREVAAELCALLAFSATFNDDKVGTDLVSRWDRAVHSGAERTEACVARGARGAHARVASAGQWTGRDHRTRRRLRWLPFGAAARLRRAGSTGDEHCRSDGVPDVGLQAAGRLFCGQRLLRRRLSAGHADGQSQARCDRGVDHRSPRTRDSRMSDWSICSIRKRDRRSQCDTGSAAFRDSFAVHARQRIADLEYAFRSAKIDFIHVDSAASVVDPLARFFRMREKRRQR